MSIWKTIPHGLVFGLLFLLVGCATNLTTSSPNSSESTEPSGAPAALNILNANEPVEDISQADAGTLTSENQSARENQLSESRLTTGDGLDEALVAGDNELSDDDGRDSPSATAFVPALPQCMVPANSGDGSDYACRALAQSLVSLGLSEDEIEVVNLAGAGGLIAFRQAAGPRRSDDNLIVAASPATTLRIAQGEYDPLTTEDVRWLGVVAADFGVIAVANDSPLLSLSDLLAALEDEPASIRFGGGDPIGGQDHMKLQLLTESAGLAQIELIYTPFEGGGDALRAMKAGFIDVFPGDVSEVISGIEAGDLRLLAVLTPQRIETFPNVPTAIEMGYDTQWVIFHGFYAPGEMSDQAFAWWSAAIEQVAGTPEWAEIRASVGMDEFFMGGDEFSKMVQQQVEDFAELSTAFGFAYEDQTD